MLTRSHIPALCSVFALLFGGCDQRKTAEAQFVGSWHSSACIDCTFDLTFFPDHTFISSGESLGRYWINGVGKWYLDYKRIFLRRKDADEHALIILKVADVTPDELKISHGDWVETYKRVKTMTREEIQNMAEKPVEYSATP